MTCGLPTWRPEHIASSGCLGSVLPPHRTRPCDPSPHVWSHALRVVGRDVFIFVSVFERSLLFLFFFLLFFLLLLPPIRLSVQQDEKKGEEACKKIQFFKGIVIHLGWRAVSFRKFFWGLCSNTKQKHFKGKKMEKKKSFFFYFSF